MQHNMHEQLKQLKALTKPKNCPEKFQKGVVHTNFMNHTFEEILKEFWSTSVQ